MVGPLEGPLRVACWASTFRPTKSCVGSRAGSVPVSRNKLDPVKSTVTGVEGLARDLDEEVLSSVAKVLHNWTPSQNVIDLGGSLKRLFPKGFDVDDLLG